MDFEWFAWTSLHNHTVSLGGAVGPPCAGSCAGSAGSWTAGNCCVFGCGWWGWSFGWILYRTPCTRVVSHLSRDQRKKRKICFRLRVCAFKSTFSAAYTHLCVWRCVSSYLTSGETFCHSTGRGRVVCRSGWGGGWTGWTSAWTLFHTPCSQSCAPGNKQTRFIMMFALETHQQLLRKMFFTFALP